MHTLSAMFQENKKLSWTECFLPVRIKCILTLDSKEAFAKMKTSRSKVTLSSIFQIHLISSKIFSYLTLLELLPIRFVCREFYQQIINFTTNHLANANQLNYDNPTQRLPSSSLSNILDTSILFLQNSSQNYFHSRSYTRINLSRCHWLENCNLLQLTMKSNVALQELFLDHCWNISYHVLAISLKSCPNLVKLSVANIYSIEDQFLVTIAECCPQLKWLNAKECWRITDAGIR